MREFNEGEKKNFEHLLLILIRNDYKLDEDTQDTFNRAFAKAMERIIKR